MRAFDWASAARAPTLPGNVDSLPAAPASEVRAYAPGEISPQSAREKDLCARASHPDWVYLGSLALLDVGAIWGGSAEGIKNAGSEPIRFTGPVMIGLAWGATIGGAWLALPKCSPYWVGEPPPEGSVRQNWPLAISLALLAGSTAPIINAIAIGYDLPIRWSTEERAGHVVAAGLAGLVGAFLPYLLPPRTYRAAQELARIRVRTDGRGGLFADYVARF